MVSILAILTNTIRYRYGIDASGIEAEPVGFNAAYPTTTLPPPDRFVEYEGYTDSS
jgi:hypothetical protein